MRGIKSSATIQQDHVIQLMAVLILHLLCAYVTMDFVHVLITKTFYFGAVFHLASQ